jgi:hypothetical protein
VPAPEFAPTAVASAAFEVPAAAVWAFRLDFANLPDYNPDVSGVERITEGAGVGGASGVGARYRFELADARRPWKSNRVELWAVDAVEPTLVSAAMVGGHEAYEEFVVTPLDGDRCEATLTLWVTLPAGLPPETVEAAASGALGQIRRELDLMVQVLEERAGGPSVH